MPQTDPAELVKQPGNIMMVKNLATTFKRGATVHLDRAKLAKLGYGEAALDIRWRRVCRSAMARPIPNRITVSRNIRMGGVIWSRPTGLGLKRRGGSKQ